MKKLTLISAFMALIFLTACSTPAQPTELPTTGDTTTTTAPTLETLPAETPSPGYTLAEVSTHATTKDCRTAVDGKVYDITSAFGKHEGGDEALMKLCGKEGTTLFTQQHGTNEKAKGFLKSLVLGVLK